MKILEKILLFIFCVIFVINIWIADDYVTFTLFCITLIIFLLIYLFFGYFIFKSNTTKTQGKSLPILNGVFISICFFILIAKFLEPTFPKYILLITVPLFLITLYYGYKTLKESNIEIAAYYKKAFLKNTIYFAIFLLVIISPPRIFAEIIYGNKSSTYYLTMQEYHIKEAKSFKENGEIGQAILNIDKALEYSKIEGNNILYQQCLNELGSIYYADGKYNKADSVLDIVLSSYNLMDYKNIEPQYQSTYYDAIYTKALVNSSWGNYYIADSLYQIALNYYTDNITLAYIYSDLGYFNSILGNFKIADSLLNLSINYHLKSKLENKQNYLLTLLEIAENQIKTSNFNSADSVLEKSYSFAKKEFGARDIQFAKVIDVFVSFYLKRAMYDKAEKYCLKSIKIKEPEVGITHSDYLESKIALASIYILESKYKEAETLLKEIEIIIEKEYNPKGYISIKLYDAKSRYNVDFMNYEKAQFYAEKALEGRIYRYGKYSIHTSTSYHNLASALYYQQNFYNADSLFNLSLMLRKHYLGTENPDYLASLNGLSLVLITKDSLTIAEKHLNYCLHTYEEKFGRNHPDYAIILSNIAELDIRKKLFSIAEEKLLTALQIYKNKLPEKHIKIAKVYYDLGILQSKKGNTKEAINYLEKSLAIYKSLLGNSHYFVTHIRFEINKLQTI